MKQEIMKKFGNLFRKYMYRFVVGYNFQYHKNKQNIMWIIDLVYHIKCEHVLWCHEPLLGVASAGLLSRGFSLGAWRWEMLGVKNGDKRETQRQRIEIQWTLNGDFVHIYFAYAFIPQYKKGGEDKRLLYYDTKKNQNSYLL